MEIKFIEPHQLKQAWSTMAIKRKIKRQIDLIGVNKLIIFNVYILYNPQENIKARFVQLNLINNAVTQAIITLQGMSEHRFGVVFNYQYFELLLDLY